MTNEIKIISTVRRQLAHIMASYGDQPEELMYKLEELVIEWMSKGISIGIENERKHPVKPE